MNVNIGYPFELVETGDAYGQDPDSESFAYIVTLDGYEVWRDNEACYDRPEQTIQAFAAKLKEVLT